MRKLANKNQRAELNWTEQRADEREITIMYNETNNRENIHISQSEKLANGECQKGRQRERESSETEKKNLHQDPRPKTQR